MTNTSTFFKIFAGLISFCSIGIAQPIIDSSNITPKPQETFERKNCDFASINYKNTGSNYVWNFTTVPLLSVDTIMYDSVCATNTCMYGDPALFNWWDGKSIGFTHPSSAPHNIILKKYLTNGIYTGSQTSCAGCITNGNYLEFPFPLTISTNYSVTETDCGYCSQYPYPYNSCNSTTTNTYNRKLISDGYGTLNLPSAISYTNCLRLMEVLTDTSNAVLDTTFYWFTPGIHHQVLEITTNTGFQVHGIYINKSWSTVNVTQLISNNLFNTYPNPTADQFFIDANTTNKINVDLYDVNGRHVYSANVMDKSSINVSGLDDGIYTLTIKTVDRVINKKLVIVR
ncbi:MAG: T9SS type A sorting domain-containing protein [Bacteroidia bacterium]